MEKCKSIPQQETNFFMSISLENTFKCDNSKH